LLCFHSSFSFYYSDLTILVKYNKSIFVTIYYTGNPQKNAVAWWGDRIE